MAQEEHAQKSNSSSGGGASGGGGGGCRSYKKMKQKKVPQRGLGVAQLEKIRLEEQQKKEATLQNGGLGVLSQNPVISSPTTNCNSSSGLGVQCPSSSLLRPTSISTTSSSSVPLSFPPPPPSPNDHHMIPSPKSLFRTSPSIPIVDIVGPNSLPFNSKPFNLRDATVSGQGHGNWPRMWNGEYSPEGENLRLSLPFDVNFGSQLSTSRFSASPDFAQGSQHFPPSIPSSSLMNVSTGILSSPVLNFQTEPPSNQIFSGNSYKPLWPDEEKMIGMKRPYPFSIETPPAPDFHLKYPPPYVVTPNPISRINEATSSSSSYSNRSVVSTDLDIIRYDREIPTKPSFVSPKEEVKEKQGLNGDFLSLGPPHAVGGVLQHNSFRYNNNNSNVSGHHQQGLFGFAPQPSRGGNEDNFAEARCSKSMRTSFFSFLPPSTTTTTTKKQIDQNAPDAANNCNGEVGENVDLSLKL